jgi:hypothetical protein
VDSFVHEILVASSAGAHCNLVTEGAGLGQGEKSAVFPKNSDSKSKWMNSLKHFSDWVDIIRGQARNRHATGTNGFDINPFSPICDSDRRPAANTRVDHPGCSAACQAAIAASLKPHRQIALLAQTRFS